MTLRGHQMNDYALDAIDSEWKSYFLGLFAADGHCRGNQVTIKLQKLDAGILKQLQSYFGLTRDISNDGEAKVLYFTSAKIAQSISVLGLHGKKVDRLTKLPDIPHGLMRHFIRGYFDGDGSVSLRKARKFQVILYICSISKPFLQAVQHWLGDNGICGRIYCEQRVGRAMKVPQGGISICCHDMYSLKFNTHHDRLKLIDLCWGNAHIYIPRKRKILMKYAKSQTEIHNFISANGSRSLQWSTIYREYLAGSTVKSLTQANGCNWRSFYTWIKRNGLPSRTSSIVHSLGDQGNKIACHLLEVPKADSATANP